VLQGIIQLGRQLFGPVWGGGWGRRRVNSKQKAMDTGDGWVAWLPPLRLDRTHTDIERARKKDGEGERAPERQERLYRQKRPTTEAKKPTIEAKRFRHIQTATTRPPATTTRTRSRTKIRGQKSFLPHSSRRRRRQASVADTCNPGTDTNNFKIEANSRARYYLAGSWNVYILEMQFLFFCFDFFCFEMGVGMCTY
jgi:hypothetical protein